MAKTLTFLALLVLLSSVFVISSDARALRLRPKSVTEREMVKVLEDLYIKSGGPRNNGFALTLEGIKKSGPSPGAGN
ncbi:hypothetical protein AAHA92_07092 [Salvia divinorum]|uniref:Uncharacterized protein n=1 Tax=Salvia divinorum TaxID=28513 RepID=A0ABD1IA79_SALDI